MANKTYTAEQIKTGSYDIHEIFGYVVVNPLPFRLVGFEESETAKGAYEAQVMCGETLTDVVGAKNRGWCDVVLGIYRLAPDGRTWNLIPDSWKRGFAATAEFLNPYDVAEGFSF